MPLIRPICKKDLKTVQGFATEAGVGMTHLPQSQQELTHQLKLSQDSFKVGVEAPGAEEYLFVLADGNEIGGICGINASVGFVEPVYFFTLTTAQQTPLPLPRLKENRIIQLKAVEKGPSEICALFLSSKWRSSGLGKLLSWSRFLFMAAFPERFQKYAIANFIL